MTTEYTLRDGMNRLVTGGLVLEEGDTVELADAVASEFGDALVPVEQHECDECGDSFETAQGLSNHRRTHQDNVNEEN